MLIPYLSNHLQIHSFFFFFYRSQKEAARLLTRQPRWVTTYACQACRAFEKPQVSRGATEAIVQDLLSFSNSFLVTGNTCCVLSKSFCLCRSPCFHLKNTSSLNSVAGFSFSLNSIAYLSAPLFSFSFLNQKDKSVCFPLRQKDMEKILSPPN